MTTAELLAIPDDDVRRWLIRGELRERGSPETRFRPRANAAALAQFSAELGNWHHDRPKPNGEVYCAVWLRLPGTPETVVMADAVYVSPEVEAAQPADETFVHGVPTVIVEIPSPSNTSEDIEEKLDAYLEAGVPITWIVNPRRRTILAYRPDAEPVLFTASDDLTAEPHLLGFRVRVASLFE
jgi:Uma2 family endonuclease